MAPRKKTNQSQARREAVERALAFHLSQGNIGSWHHVGAGPNYGYNVSITDYGTETLSTLREAEAFVFGLASAHKAHARRAPELWAIDAQVLTHMTDDNGQQWDGSRQVPTFYLDAKVQGIEWSHGAKHIARQVIDPMGTLDLSVSATKVSG